MCVSEKILSVFSTIFLLLSGAATLQHNGDLHTLSYGLWSPAWNIPQLNSVYSYSDRESFSLPLSLSLFPSLHVLDIKRENPISAVTFCLCSRNIQGLYIKARQSAQWGERRFNDDGVVGDNVKPLRGSMEVIIPSINSAPDLSYKYAGNMKLTV